MNSLGRTGWVGSPFCIQRLVRIRDSIVQRVPRQRRRRVTASGRYSDRLRRCLLPLSPRLIALEAGLRFERSGTVDTPDHGPNLKARGRSRFFELHPARVRGFARLSTGTDHESVPGAFGTVAGAFAQRVCSCSHLFADRFPSTALGRDVPQSVERPSAFAGLDRELSIQGHGRFVVHR